MQFKLTEDSIYKIPHDCLIKLQAIYDTLKSAEKKAADLFLEMPDFFANASIVEAANKAGCSEATFVRLARKLGYSGYPEMKSILLGNNGNGYIQPYADITEDDDYDVVIDKVFQVSIQALKDTLNILDKEEYKKAVDAICGTNKLVFSGVGDAATVARSGYQKFMRLGINVHASEDQDVLLVGVAQMAKDDVLIAISHSGRTKSVLDVVKYARSLGVTTICITNYPISPLAKNSDIVLLTAAFTEHAKGEVVSKRVAQMCILESLYINVLLKRKKELIENLDRSNQVVEVNKL